MALDPLVISIILLIAILVTLIAVLLLALNGNRSGDQLRNTMDSHFSSHREEIGRDREQASQTLNTAFELQKNLLEQVSKELKETRERNDKKLEEIRITVDEKLHDTLGKRLGESFRKVQQQLGEVNRGLGEMQTLASNVGDLKKVLSNVKQRGTWGEIQLSKLLSDIMTPEQYQKNVAINPENNNRVDFAIQLPGKNDGQQEVLWLPIDSKFPQEDLIRIQEAAHAADEVELKKARADFAKALKSAAESIQEKYICPPHTTDFAVMFLATEGLYAEALYLPGLIDDLQVRCRILLTGPMTLSALLNSLSVGFHTLAVNKTAAKIQKTLSGVKTEFHKFGEALTKVKKQLQTATKSIDDTQVRTRAMERQLSSVETLPPTQEDQSKEDQPVFLEEGDDEETDDTASIDTDQTS